MPGFCKHLEKLTLWHLRCRRMAKTQISAATRNAVRRFEKHGADALEGMDDVDACTMDLVLRQGLLCS